MLHSAFPLKNTWIIDDNKNYCRHITGILKDGGVTDEISVYHTCESALRSISRVSVFPELMLLDVYFAGTQMTGLDALPRIKKIMPQTKVIILTAFEEDVNARFALRLGASGFLVKLAQSANILEAINVSMLNGLFIDSMLLARLVSRSDLRKRRNLLNLLTIRENEIIKMICSGLKRPQIAEKLLISLATVNTHLKNIHSKMDVNSDLEIIAKMSNEYIDC